jgi:uncharacterized protein (DUF2141 family)
MRRSILLGAVCLAMSWGTAASQMTRDAQGQIPAPTGTGVMMGTVTMAGTGQPVEGVRVTLSGTELRSSRSALTNDDGQFVFDKLPAGTYTVRGTRTGHISGTYGQKQPGKPGTSIVLAAGQQLKDVTFEIAKGGVISGVVLDEKNRPSIGTPVRVMRWMMQSGERALTTAGTGTTDDRGMYRIYNLTPGDYVVSAVPRNSAAEVLTAMDMATQARMEELSARGLVNTSGIMFTASIEPDGRVAGMADPVQGYAPVFYPGTSQLAGARAIRVGIAEEQLGIDFALQRVPLSTVTGQVIMPSGQNPTTVQVRLLQAEGNALGIGQQSVRPSQNGTFTFRSVVPGQYMVFAVATVNEPRGAMVPTGVGQWESAPQPGVQRRIWAQSDLFVDGNTPPVVSLTMREGMTVSGQISFSGTLPQANNAQRVRVSLAPLGQVAQSLGLGNMQGMVDAAGRFTINGVIPGRYRVSASGGAQGWMLKSVVANGLDVLDFPLELEPDTNAPSLALQFGDRNTDLKGVLTDAMGAATADYSVVIFPEDQRYWVPYARRMRSTRPATDGKFAFVGLPPGDYRIAAVTDVETGEWLDPEFLRQLLPASISVRLADGQQVTQDIRVR